VQVDILGKGLLLAHVVGQREVAVGRLALRQVDRRAEARLLAAAQGLPAVHHVVEPHPGPAAGVHVAERALPRPLPLVAQLDQRTAHDGPGVDHRIVGAVVLVEGQLVEAGAAGLVTDDGMHGLFAVLLQGQAVVDRLAGRLDGEEDLRVAGGIPLPVDGAQRDPVLVDLRFLQVELRNVVGGLAGPLFARDRVDPVDLGAELGEVRNHHLALQGPLDQQDVLPDRLAEVVLRDRLLGFLVRGEEGVQGGHAFPHATVVAAQTGP